MRNQIFDSSVEDLLCARQILGGVTASACAEIIFRNLDGVGACMDVINVSNGGVEAVFGGDGRMFVGDFGRQSLVKCTCLA